MVSQPGQFSDVIATQHVTSCRSPRSPCSLPAVTNVAIRGRACKLLNVAHPGAPKAVTDKLQRARTPQHVSSATRGSLTTV